MSLTRAKAHEVSDDGVLLENGVWLSSGANVPSHSANFGDRYFQIDGTEWANTSVPSPGNTWTNVTTSAAGAIKPYPFVTTGNTNNKWLGAFVPSTFSNVNPLLIGHNAEIDGILFSNGDDNVDIDIEIYKNGVLDHTELIRNKRTYYNIGVFTGDVFNQGDRVSVFLRKFTGGTGDQTAQDPIVVIQFKFLDAQPGTGGTQFGV